MLTLHLRRQNEFFVFIESPKGNFFKISGEGKVAFTKGEYLDDFQFQKEIKRLRSVGFRRSAIPSSS